MSLQYKKSARKAITNFYKPTSNISRKSSKASNNYYKIFSKNLDLIDKLYYFYIKLIKKKICLANYWEKKRKKKLLT
jgi:hypothetical protein